MTDERLETALKRAAEIAKQLPENLQEAGFNRALDQLLGGQEVERAKSRVGSGRAEPPRSPHVADETPDGLLEVINRTKYPDVGSTARVADRALKVLQIANDDHHVDGLTAQQVAEILTTKFRLPVSANSVNMALERESDTVDVRQRDGMKRFHLMAPGEEYLKRLREGEMIGQRRSRRTRPAEKKDKTAAKKPPRPSKEAPTTSAKTGSRSRPGPKAAVEQLVAADFFKTGRTIASIQQQLKHKRGHSYTLQELSPTLVRLLRQEILNRERNASGQYEYTQA